MYRYSEIRNQSGGSCYSHAVATSILANMGLNNLTRDHYMKLITCCTSAVLALYREKTRDAFNDRFAIHPAVPSLMAQVKAKFGVIPDFPSVETVLDEFTGVAADDADEYQQAVDVVQEKLHAIIADVKQQTDEFMKAKFSDSQTKRNKCTAMVRVFFAYGLVKRIENFLINLKDKYTETKIDGLVHALVRQVAVLVNPKDELFMWRDSLLEAPEKLLDGSLKPQAIFDKMDRRATFTHSIDGCGATSSEIKTIVRLAPVSINAQITLRTDPLDQKIAECSEVIQRHTRMIAIKNQAKIDKSKEDGITHEKLQKYVDFIDNTIKQLNDEKDKAESDKRAALEEKGKYMKIFAILSSLQVTDILTYSTGSSNAYRQGIMRTFLDNGVPLSLSVAFFGYMWRLISAGDKSEVWTSEKLCELIGDVLIKSFQGIYAKATRQTLMEQWQTRSKANGDLFVELKKTATAKYSVATAKGINTRLQNMYTTHFENRGWGLLAATQKQVKITTGGHIMSVIGYGYKNNKMYVIVKNSWGTDWACGGYFRIETDCHSYHITKDDDNISRLNLNFDCINIDLPASNPYGIAATNTSRTFKEVGSTATADRFSIIKGYKGTEDLPLEKAVAVALHKPYTATQLGLAGGSTSHLGEIGLDVDEETPVKDLHTALGLKLGFQDKCMMSIAGKKIHEDEGETLKDFGYLSGGCLKLENCRNLYLHPVRGVEYVLPIAHHDFDAPGVGKAAEMKMDEVAEIEMQLDKLVQMLSWREHSGGKMFDTRMEYRIELPKAACNAPEVVTSEYLLFDANMFGVYGCVHYSDTSSFFLVSKDQASQVKNIDGSRRFEVSKIWEMGA